MTPPCGCRIEIPDLPTGRAYVLDTKYVKPELFTIVYCPLHAQAKAMRDKLDELDRAWGGTILIRPDGTRTTIREAHGLAALFAKVAGTA